MSILKHKGKSYSLDPLGFLANTERWDENFVEGMAPKLRIEKGLTKEHWDIIYSIRNRFEETGISHFKEQAWKAKGNADAGTKMHGQVPPCNFRFKLICFLCYGHTMVEQHAGFNS